MKIRLLRDTKFGTIALVRFVVRSLLYSRNADCLDTVSLGVFKLNGLTMSHSGGVLCMLNDGVMSRKQKTKTTHRLYMVEKIILWSYDVTYTKPDKIM